MLRRRTFAARLALAALPGGCTTMAATPPDAHALDRELRALTQDARAPLLALSALALRDGEVVYHGAFGQRHLGSPARPGALPVDGRTLFRMASITKLVVSVGVMRLLEEGRLSLDDDVSRWMGFELRHPRHPRVPITLRHLLSHRSGLSDGGERYFFDGDTRLQDVLHPRGPRYDGGLNWDAGRTPGTAFRYVNLDFGVIAQVMEGATGERFDRLMQRLVLRPLGMRGGFDPASMPAADVADIAALYRRRRVEQGRELWDPQGPWVLQADDFRSAPPDHPAGLGRYVVGTNGTLFGPQGRLRTGVADLGVLMRMLAQQGRHEGQAFLQPATVALLASEQWRHDGTANGSERDWALSWGLGVQRYTDQGGPGRGDRLVQGGGFTGWGHGAEAYGLMGVWALDPLRRDGLVVVCAGPGIDPDGYRGHDTSLYRWQEQALTLLARHALGRA